MLLGSHACRLGLTPKWKWHSEESPTLAGRAPPPPSLHTISAIILNIQYTCILFYPSHHFIRCGQTLKLSARSSALPPKVTTTTHPLRPDLLHLLISSSSSSSISFSPPPPLHISLCFIHHLCEVEPNLQAQRARLATAPLRAGLINYPPRQPDGIAGAHRMTDPEPCGQPGAACSGPLPPLSFSDPLPLLFNQSQRQIWSSVWYKWACDRAVTPWESLLAISTSAFWTWRGDYMVWT